MKHHALDPYAEDIRRMLDNGHTYAYIADELSEKLPDCIETHVVGYYARKHLMKSRVTQGCRDNRIAIPNCNSCENCHLVKSIKGKTSHRICVVEWQMISRQCITSPDFCPKRDIEKYCEE